MLYVFLVTKAIYIAKTAKDTTGSLIASGIAGIFLFHMAENIGMVMGLLPITGVPLLLDVYKRQVLLILTSTLIYNAKGSIHIQNTTKL